MENTTNSNSEQSSDTIPGILWRPHALNMDVMDIDRITRAGRAVTPIPRASEILLVEQSVTGSGATSRTSRYINPIILDQNAACSPPSTDNSTGYEWLLTHDPLSPPSINDHGISGLASVEDYLPSDSRECRNVSYAQGAEELFLRFLNPDRPSNPPSIDTDFVRTDEAVGPDIPFIDYMSLARGNSDRITYTQDSDNYAPGQRGYNPMKSINSLISSLSSSRDLNVRQAESKNLDGTLRLTPETVVKRLHRADAYSRVIGMAFDAMEAEKPEHEILVELREYVQAQLNLTHNAAPTDNDLNLRYCYENILAQITDLSRSLQNG